MEESKEKEKLCIKERKKKSVRGSKEGGKGRRESRKK